jgi:hypothetical protein
MFLFFLCREYIVRTVDGIDASYEQRHAVSLLPMKNMLDKNSVQGILKKKGLVDNESEKRELKLVGAPMPYAQFGRDSRQQGGVPRCMLNPANMVIRSIVYSKRLKLVYRNGDAATFAGEWPSFPAFFRTYMSRLARGDHSNAQGQADLWKLSHRNAGRLATSGGTAGP